MAVDVSKKFNSSDVIAEDAVEFVSNGEDHMSLNGLATHETDSIIFGQNGLIIQHSSEFKLNFLYLYFHFYPYHCYLDLPFCPTDGDAKTSSSKSHKDPHPEEPPMMYF